MQPIAVAVGLTVTILALTALLAGPHVSYLAPHTRVLQPDLRLHRLVPRN